MKFATCALLAALASADSSNWINQNGGFAHPQAHPQQNMHMQGQHHDLGHISFQDRANDYNMHHQQPFHMERKGGPASYDQPFHGPTFNKDFHGPSFDKQFHGPTAHAAHQPFQGPTMHKTFSGHQFGHDSRGHAGHLQSGPKLGNMHRASSYDPSSIQKQQSHAHPLQNHHQFARNMHHQPAHPAAPKVTHVPHKTSGHLSREHLAGPHHPGAHPMAPHVGHAAHLTHNHEAPMDIMPQHQPHQQFQHQHPQHSAPSHPGFGHPVLGHPSIGRPAHQQPAHHNQHLGVESLVHQAQDAAIHPSEHKFDFTLQDFVGPINGQIHELTGICDDYKHQIDTLENASVTEDFFNSNAESISTAAGTAVELYGPWCIVAGKTIDLHAELHIDGASETTELRLKNHDQVVAHAKGPNLSLIYKATVGEEGGHFTIEVQTPTIGTIASGDLSMGYKVYGGEGYHVLTELPQSCELHDYEAHEEEAHDD